MKIDPDRDTEEEMDEFFAEVYAKEIAEVLGLEDTEMNEIKEPEI
jgi:hypothetical protein